MTLMQTLRLHQWLKNLLIFVPLFTSQLGINIDLLKLGLTGFIGFSLVCSANYIINDIIDISRDQSVKYKSQRPIASGKIRKNTAIYLSVALSACGFGLCFYSSRNFVLITLLYLLLGLFYSVYLKSIPQLDLIVLVLFYEIRIFAGGQLFNLEISFWLIIFSFSIFSSLAFVKKFSKAVMEAKNESANLSYSFYNSQGGYFAQFGISFAVLSILTFALYLNSEEVQYIYNQPKFLWILIPVLQFLLLRVWDVTLRGQMHYDPLVFLLRDRACNICICLMFLGVIAIGKVH